MATRQTLDIMAIRYGEDFCETRQVADGAARVGGVEVSFHPAGHVLGSAQIRLACDDGPVIVVSGDYCRTPNPVCAPWEPVACDIFVTEATFGLPVFKHPDPAGEMTRLLASMAEFPERHHLIGAYALGKAQRVIALVRQAGHDGPIHLHGAVQRLTDYHVEQGIALGDLRPATGAPKDALRGHIVLSPPGALNDRWSRRLPDPITAMASGWMHLRGMRRRYGVDRGFALSDHADWPGLVSAQTGWRHSPSPAKAPPAASAMPASRTRCIAATGAAA